MPVPKVRRSENGISTYAGLRRLVEQTLLEGRRRIEQAKVQACWQTGKYIREHILHHEHRAEYGRQVIGRLSEDLGISDRLLYQMHQFYQAFPISHARAKSFPGLTWTHYRQLSAISDENLRLSLLRRAGKSEWSHRQLAEKIRCEIKPGANGRTAVIPAEAGIHPTLSPVTLGPFYTYKIIRPKTIHSRENEWLVDLGFGHTVELNALTEKRFPEETIITSVKDPQGRYSLKKSPTQPSSATTENEILYTYKAYVEKVIDGDTLKVEFQLGFGNRKHETIRLNHINSLELNTAKGVAAKQFVEARLAPCEFITIKSVKTRKEKWGRYLGDVFFKPKGKDAPIYLNQLLLDKHHAVRVYK